MRRPVCYYRGRVERSGTDLGVSAHLDDAVFDPASDVLADVPAGSSLDDYEASSLLSYSHSELSFADSHSATKPWFIRKLPSRLEVMEGQSLSIVCRTSGVGCRPWFVKRLPARVEVERGNEINMDCSIGSVSEELLEVGARSTSWILEQKIKKGATGNTCRCCLHFLYPDNCSYGQPPLSTEQKPLGPIF